MVTKIDFYFQPLFFIRMNDGKVVYEAVCGVTVLPSSELIRELEELSLNKVSSPSPAPSETASSRTSNTTPDLQLHNPSLDILSALDTVQGTLIILLQNMGRAGFLHTVVVPMVCRQRDVCHNAVDIKAVFIL